MTDRTSTNKGHVYNDPSRWGERFDQPAPSEGLLRALFSRYIEYHGEPDQWDDDGGWCQKHAPTVAEVRTALATEYARLSTPETSE